MIRTPVAVSAAAALLAAQAAAGAVIYAENFDGAGTLGFTTEDTDGNAVAQFNNGGAAHFTVTDGNNVPGTYGNAAGNFFAAQDLNGTGKPDTLRLRIDGIDVSGFTDLTLSVDVAEDDDGSNQDWDASDFVHVNLGLDTVNGGADNDPSLYGLWFEAGAFTSGAGNGEPRLDRNYDGDITAADDPITAVTDSFTTFETSFAQTGNTASILITFSLGGGDEDFAVDNITLSGTAVPEPLAAGAAGAVGLLALRRRRAV